MRIDDTGHRYRPGQIYDARRTGNLNICPYSLDAAVFHNNDGLLYVLAGHRDRPPNLERDDLVRLRGKTCG